MHAPSAFRYPLRVVLSRAARSVRRAPHYNLESPSQPVTGPYYCHKHRRICKPTENALKFLRRYTEDVRADLAYAFLIFRSDDNVLVGGLTLANIRRGVAQRRIRRGVRLEAGHDDEPG